jgi:hypothetical protein
MGITAIGFGIFAGFCYYAGLYLPRRAAESSSTGEMLVILLKSDLL